MADQEQWYSNKELFEQINELKYEMKETRNLIKQYNGLREEIGKVKDEVDEMKAEAAGKSSVLDSIRNWGGWLFGLITLIVLLSKQF
jgi:cell division septum initiation protein DivIVA